MSRLFFARMSKSISFPSCASGVHARSIEISIRNIQSSLECLDYNTNFDRQDFAAGDPESHSLWPFQLCQRNDEMRCFGVVRPFDVGFRRSRGSVGMGVIYGDKLLSGFAEIPECRNE